MNDTQSSPSVLTVIECTKRQCLSVNSITNCNLLAQRNASWAKELAIKAYLL